MEVFAIVTYCLISAPTECRVDMFPLYDAPPLACALGLPGVVGDAMRGMLPGERIARIECGVEQRV